MPLSIADPVVDDNPYARRTAIGLPAVQIRFGQDSACTSGGCAPPRRARPVTGIIDPFVVERHRRRPVPGRR